MSGDRLDWDLMVAKAQLRTAVIKGDWKSRCVLSHKINRLTGELDAVHRAAESESNQSADPATEPEAPLGS